MLDRASTLLLTDGQQLLTTGQGHAVSTTVVADARTSGARLSAAERRQQLIDVAYRQLLAHPTEPLSPEAVARAAGVSKPLIFHYFPTVSDLQLEVFDVVSGQLHDQLLLRPDLPLDERLRAGIEAFIDFAQDNAELYLFLVRGGGSDAQMQVALDHSRERVARLIGGAVGLEDPPPALLVALRGLLGLIEEAVLEWLARRTVPRQALVDFLCTVGAQATDATVTLLLTAHDTPAEATTALKTLSREDRS